MLIVVKNTIVASNRDPNCEIVWIRKERANNKLCILDHSMELSTPPKDEPEVINMTSNIVHESVAKLISKDTALPNSVLNGDCNTPDIVWITLTILGS